MATTIQIKRSSTASGVPLATDLAVGELAVNLADKRLFTKQSDGTIIELSTNPTDLDAATLRIDGVEITASATELNKLDGFTGSTAELNILDGLTATTIELNTLDGITASTAELNKLDGYTGSTAELNILDGVTATTAELNKLDGFTGVVDDLNYAKDLRATGVTTTEFDKLDGLTATTAELNILDGVTATTAELNITDGLTATTSELNVLDGITATTTELNYTDGVTSNIQTQLNGKATTAQGALADSAVQPNDNVSFGTGDFSGAVTVTSTVTADEVDVVGTITANAANVTGTVTADSLTVDKNYAFQGANYHFKLGENSGDSYLGSFGNGHFSATGYYYGSNQYQLTGGSTNLTGYAATSDFTIFAEDGLTANSLATSKARLRIDGATGDVSFYEDTGTTAKFVWDASAESLGIGTSSPSAKLDVNGDISVGSGSTVSWGGAYGVGIPSITGLLGGLRFYPNGSTSGETMRIDSSGNVGIGTASPSNTLHVNSGGSNDVVTFESTDSTANLLLKDNTGSFRISNATTDTLLHSNYSATHGNLRFYSNSTSERARIDSSGNLLVGQTTPSNTAAGMYVRPSSSSGFIADGTGALTLGRLNSDGAIASFLKDGSTVGSIGTQYGSTFIAGATATSGVLFNGNGLIPTNVTGTVTNNSMDLGQSGNAFKDLYLSGGVYLGGTGAANKLDDYEEGTWTPEYVHFDGSSYANFPSITYDIQEGHYVKVGRMVTLFFRIRTDSLSKTGVTGTNPIAIDNVPFSFSEGGSGVLGAQAGWAGQAPTYAQVVNGDVISLRRIADGSSGYTISDVDDMGTTTDDNRILDASITYLTTA